jgi:hypothetical protein
MTNSKKRSNSNDSNRDGAQSNDGHKKINHLSEFIIEQKNFNKKLKHSSPKTGLPQIHTYSTDAFENYNKKDDIFKYPIGHEWKIININNNQSDKETYIYKIFNKNDFDNQKIFKYDLTGQEHAEGKYDKKGNYMVGVIFEDEKKILVKINPDDEGESVGGRKSSKRRRKSSKRKTTRRRR